MKVMNIGSKNYRGQTRMIKTVFSGSTDVVINRNKTKTKTR